MPTIEKRVQALEQENATRKQTEEWLTITVRALVSKEAFEKLQETIKESQEKYGKLFNVLINQGDLHNKRLTELQDQIIEVNRKIIEVDGKVVGLQTEMRQRFTKQDGKITGLQTEMDRRFTEQDGKITGLQTTQAEHTTLLKQILERLPEKPTA
ncbi:MAG: hypothetical protein ACRDHW_01390 [Ktedonobacteraceae bacterium]